MSESKQEDFQRDGPITANIQQPQQQQQQPTQQQQHQHQHQHQQQKQGQLHTTVAQDPSQPVTSVPRNYKRKRESLDAAGEAEQGRQGADGGTNSRRTSIKHTSPNHSATTFMPINPNAPPNAQYAYQPLNVAQQHSPNSINGSSASDAANTALAVNAMSSLMPSLGVQAVMMTSGEQHAQMDGGGGFPAMSPQPVEGHTEGVGGALNHVVARQPTQPPVTVSNPKPQVGTEEWHRVRRDNHKEVERRRRETINEGINELAKIVPGCEKNKGSILQRAVQYIQQLKENEAQNIHKWSLEKHITEQALQDLSQNCEKLQKEVDRAWREAETWKKSCLQAGVTRESGGQGGGQGESLWPFMAAASDAFSLVCKHEEMSELYTRISITAFCFF